jgi:hypothetical protein
MALYDFSVLQRNDEILEGLIRDMSISSEYRNSDRATQYKDIILRYYHDVRPTSIDRDPLGIRTRCATEALREYWVEQALKYKAFQIIESFGNFEDILFQLENYRGHFVHQFNVFVIGYYVLNKTLGNPGKTAGYFYRSNDPNFTWMLAATFHDVGYPIEQVDSWFSNVLQMFLKTDTSYKIEIEKALTPVFFEYVKYLSETQMSLKFNKRERIGQPNDRDWRLNDLLLTNLRKKDHGVIGALSLIHSLLTQEGLASNQEWLDGTFPGEIMPACHAISLHNLSPTDVKIDSKNYPYAFLLSLCDELQDWGRSIAEKDHSELVDLGVDFKQEVPVLYCTLKINDEEKKHRALDGLKAKLDGNGLIRICISQEGKSEKWEI